MKKHLALCAMFLCGVMVFPAHGNVGPSKKKKDPVKKEELVKEEPVNKELNASDVIPVVETPQKKRNWLLNYFNWVWK